MNADTRYDVEAMGAAGQWVVVLADVPRRVARWVAVLVCGRVSKHTGPVVTFREQPSLPFGQPSFAEVMAKMVR